MANSSGGNLKPQTNKMFNFNTLNECHGPMALLSVMLSGQSGRLASPANRAHLLSLRYVKTKEKLKNAFSTNFLSAF